MPKKSTRKTAKKVTPSITNQQTPEAVKPVEPGSLSVELLDLEALQVTEDSQIVEANKCTIGACKSDSLEFIRVKNDPAWPKIIVSLIEFKPTQEFWIVVPEIAQSAGKNSEIAKYRLHLAITEYGRLFIWPVNLGRGSWNESRRVAVKDASHKWVRVKGHFERKEYITIEATDDLGTPKWPNLTPQEVVTIAFGDRVIRDHNHHLLRKLQGKSGR